MKSKFKILGAGLVVGLFVLGAVFMPYLLIESPNVQQSSTIPIELYVLTLIIGVGYLAYEIIKNLNTVSITNDSILFKNVFLKTQYAYQFTDLDGFITQSQLASGDMYDVIYLIKGDREIKKIPSFYYSNYKELKQFLNKRLQYLGQ